MESSLTKSSLTLTGRNMTVITGVKKVKSAEPACVVAILDSCSVVITGSNLTVQNVSISQGTLELTGTVSNIKYTNTISRKFSFKNMFR